MSSLRAHALASAHSDAVTLFENASFHLVSGWTGLVGANGAGKSTLLRILAGELAPIAGTLKSEPDPSHIVLVRQAVDGLDDAIRAFSWDWEADAVRLRRVLRLDPDALDRWDTLSPGERRRWQLGAALGAAPDVLLLDEPTNHLDADGRGWLLEALRTFRGVGVVVSHDRELLDALTTRTLRLHARAATLFTGNYTASRAQWQAARDRQLADLEAHSALVRKHERRFTFAKREQAAADAGRSAKVLSKGKLDSDSRGMAPKTMSAWAEAKAGRNVAVVRDELERVRAEKPDFEVDRTLGRSVFVGYERAPMPWLLQVHEDAISAGNKPIARDVHLDVGRADRVWITGPNGAGKTTLVNALLARSRLPPQKVLVLPQDLTAGEEREALAAVKALSPEVKGRVLSLVAALGVDPAALLASEQPSAGEARKLLLALGLGRHVWALVLDEPTNHLDLPSIESLEAALEAFPGAIVLVSHDAAFGARVARERWAIEDGVIRRESVAPA